MQGAKLRRVKRDHNQRASNVIAVSLWMKPAILAVDYLALAVATFWGMAKSDEMNALGTN